jgi:hypothetical protein
MVVDTKTTTPTHTHASPVSDADNGRVILQLLYTTQTTMGYEVGNLAHGMANNGMTDAQRAALSPSNPEYDMRVIGSKIQVAGWSCYSTLMVVLKLAMLFFYLRLTVGVLPPCYGRSWDLLVGRMALVAAIACASTSDLR